jgi:hypothetical protein
MAMNLEHSGASSMPGGERYVLGSVDQRRRAGRVRQRPPQRQAQRTVAGGLASGDQGAAARRRSRRGQLVAAPRVAHDERLIRIADPLVQRARDRDRVLARPREPGEAQGEASCSPALQAARRARSPGGTTSPAAVDHRDVVSGPGPGLADLCLHRSWM